MSSFKCIVLIALAFAVGSEGSGIPAAIAAAPVIAPAHVGYAHAVPQNIPPYAAQINVVNKALSPLVAPVPQTYFGPAPYFAGPAPIAAAPYNVPTPAFAAPGFPAPVLAAPGFPAPGYPIPAAYSAPFPYAPAAPIVRAPYGFAPTFVR